MNLFSIRFFPRYPCNFLSVARITSEISITGWRRKAKSVGGLHFVHVSVEFAAASSSVALGSGLLRCGREIEIFVNGLGAAAAGQTPC